MSNKGKHIYYCHATFLSIFFKDIKYLTVMASSDEEAINKAKEQFEHMANMFSGITYKDLVVQNNKRIKVN